MSPGLSRQPGNLPAEATTFVGRRRDLLELKRKLASVRLVSLVGPGGVGKTRLALRAAGELRRGYRDGAWLLELAEIKEPELVPGGFLEALGLHDLTAAEPLALLLNYLREKQMLVLFDNCEHLVTACASLADAVLKEAGDVKLLATSREPLAIAGEYVQTVSPLELPESGGGANLGTLRENEAVALFTERAKAASGHFELTSANQHDVVEVCRRVDGLPLALELAAARTRNLSLNDIRERLGDRFGLLTGGSRAALPRHQTLRLAIDWSYDLLNDPERALFRRLGLFASSFSLPAIEAISTSDGLSPRHALRLVSSLVDKSLVMVVPAEASTRYRLHDTMRDYAMAKLIDSGEEESARKAFADYYVTTCVGTFEDAIHRPDEWLNAIDLEIDNIRSVLGRFQETGDYAGGAKLAGALGWYWATRAVNEGIRWLDEFLTRPGDNPTLVAQAWLARGLGSMMQNDLSGTLPALSLALELAHAADLRRLQVQILTSLSLAQNMAGDHAKALEATREATEVAATFDDPVALVALAQSEGFNALVEGDMERATKAYSRGAEVARKLNGLYMLEYCVINLGLISVMKSEFGAAKPFFDEAFSIALRIDDRIGQFYVLDGLAFVAAGTNQPGRAARLLGAAERARGDVGATPNFLLAPLIERAEESARSSLGEASFGQELAVGRQLSREAAIADALGRAPKRPRTIVGRKSAAPGPIGKREFDVARLVAEGLSNKEIGARLFVSERTVESHVRNILIKLGFSARTQIATWFASSQYGPSISGD